MFWVILAALAAAVLVYVRATPSDPARWHVDPSTVERGTARNAVLVRPPGAGAADLVSPVFDMGAEDLARRLDGVALADPHTRRLAGSPGEGWATYVQRSRVFGFPDYVSAKAVPVEEGRSALALYSRSRFGLSDMGVNQRRVERWLAALGAGAEGARRDA